MREVSSVIACDHQEVNMLCEVSNISPRATKTSEVNNTTCVRTYGSICTALKRFTVVLENNAATCFVYTARALGQHAGLSKEVCVYVGADWLKLIC